MKLLHVRTVRSESMYPTLEAGQYILIRRSRRYCIGDVVVFVQSKKEHIKRIASMEGDFCYVLGDNPRFSKDSRDFGYVSKKNILGRVVWPREVKK